MLASRVDASVLCRTCLHGSEGTGVLQQNVLGKPRGVVAENLRLQLGGLVDECSNLVEGSGPPSMTIASPLY